MVFITWQSISTTHFGAQSERTEAFSVCFTKKNSSRRINCCKRRGSGMTSGLLYTRGSMCCFIYEHFRRWNYLQSRNLWLPFSVLSAVKCFERNLKTLNSTVGAGWDNWRRPGVKWPRLLREGLLCHPIVPFCWLQGSLLCLDCEIGLVVTERIHAMFSFAAQSLSLWTNWTRSNM